MRNVLAALMIVATATTAFPARAQHAPRLRTPMTFATVTDSLRARLTEDWREAGWTLSERKYCVTSWTVGPAPGGDSLYVATSLTLLPSRGTAHSVRIDGECIRRGVALPVAHTHPGGDCTPSRADRTQAWMRRAPFDLIICAPGVIGSYSWTDIVPTYMRCDTLYARTDSVRIIGGCVHVNR